MGITALFVIILIITLFMVSYIPKLTFRKKIFIVIAAVLICFAVLALLFVTQFGNKRTVENESVEIKK